MSVFPTEEMGFKVMVKKMNFKKSQSLGVELLNALLSLALSLLLTIIVESYFGAGLPVTPPTFQRIIADNIDPGVDPALVKIRGCGTRDLVAIKRGLLKADLKVAYPVPSDNIMDFLHHVVDCFALSISVLDEGLY